MHSLVSQYRYGGHLKTLPTVRTEIISSGSTRCTLPFSLLPTCGCEEKEENSYRTLVLTEGVEVGKEREGRSEGGREQGMK